MRKSLFILLLLGFALGLQIACERPSSPTIATRQQIWFHPMTAQADRAGINATPTQLILQNDDGLGAGLTITASAPVADDDLEWVNLDLPLPVLNAAGQPWKIDSLEVCYDVSAEVPERTFISQVRLTEMTTPEVATVRHDDGTNLHSTSPTCYGSNVADVPINGAYELSLRIVIGKTSDRIRIGAIRIFLKT
jgi:hypothetical protein